MLAMSSYIEIGDNVFTKVNSVAIESSLKEITQTAAIKLPNLRKLIDLEEGSDERLRINVGDKVIIRLGYDNNLETEFEGYVSEISPKTPIEIRCEDEMWRLKQQVVNMAWKTITLKTLIAYLYDGPVEEKGMPDIALANFRLERISKAKALLEIKEKLGLSIYFRGAKLFVGFPYSEVLDEVYYSFQKNLPFAQDSLVFKREEDIKIKLTAISVSKDNVSTQEEIGDTDGEPRTLHFYNLSPRELKEQAKQALIRLKYSGYQGSLKTFGKPFCTFGMIADIGDSKFPNRSSSVFIDKVMVEYGSSGFRRTIELGRRAK
jgi:hypothetical protein